MPFELALGNAKAFANILTAAADLTGKNPPSKVVILEVAEKETLIQITDAKRVVFMKIGIPRGIFLKYNVEGKEVIEISWFQFESVLKRGRNKDILILKKGEEPALEIIFEGVAIRTFRLPVTPILDVPRDDLNNFKKV